uniref:Putative restriction endonuclease domain-containing protein n=2 Tax=Planktothrix pseudagardhii TaxID=132604 RepID=A0A9W4CJ87_9CYAN|nr:hypothetical protein NO713_00502 [Planktothrix pseudagardhii]
MEIAIANRDLKLERTATGELIVMPPTGGIIGKKNIDIEGQLWLWNCQTKLGQVFNSSQDIEILAQPLSLSGEDILPEFILNLTEI